MWRIEFTNEFGKEYKKLPKKIQQEVSSFLEELKTHVRPKNWDIKKLSGRDSEYRCRIQNYRLLYHVYKDEVVIVAISITQRKDAY